MTDVYTPDNPPPPGVPFVMTIPLPDPPGTEKLIMPEEQGILEERFSAALRGLDAAIDEAFGE